MHDVIFESQLLKGGYLYCPKEYAVPKAKYKVIASFPDETAVDSEIEMASVVDQSGEFISQEELNYYMRLDDKK
jgi:DNA/RNA endonuclease G (NUC1)